ncbi:MAG: response regulator transcription factor [Flavipsychrobacter sp.]|nr:response regulator transcription factor [Flavipsychrobacter sp.]
MKVLLVDDEKKACTNLKNIIREFIDPNIEIVGFAHSTKEAEIKIKQHTPDAVFFDIEMPNENAFLFLERLTHVNFEIIFVTAYDEYAVKAFRYNAIDYILKPISIEELRIAVDKLKEKITFKKIRSERTISYQQLSNDIQNKVKAQKITLKDGNGIEVVAIKDICYIEAQSSYSKILFLTTAGVKEMLLTGPLSDYEDLLPEDTFYRIHRSYLVNCSHLKKIINGDTINVLLGNNINLPVSRRRYADFLNYLNYNNHYEQND